MSVGQIEMLCDSLWDPATGRGLAARVAAATGSDRRDDVQVHDVEVGDQFQAAKSQLYAAMTRAMDELEITMSGNGEIGTALREAERLQRVG